MKNKKIEKILIELKGKYNLTDYEALDLAIRIYNRRNLLHDLHDIEKKIKKTNIRLVDNIILPPKDTTGDN